jgi:hypothetical protein
MADIARGHAVETLRRPDPLSMDRQVGVATAG